MFLRTVLLVVVFALASVTAQADIAVEFGRGAEKLTVLLERADGLLASLASDRSTDRIDEVAGGLVDRAFWRVLVLILVLLGGLALLRLLPRRA